LTRRDFNALGAGFLAGSAFSYGATPQTDGSSGAPFPYGTHVYREPSLPLEQLHADFPILKRLGFSMVKIQESWSADERKEGEIDLGRVSRVVSDAKQNGLLVYFGVTMEQAPAWLWQKYPDCTMRYENNQAVIDPTEYLLPNDGKPGPCWNHPGARAAAIRFIETVGREVGRYDNILVWNVWQEIGFGFDENVGRVCYCPNTLNAFRQWLQSKFTSLDNLNGTWRSAYATWEEVDPPRVFYKVPPAIDWRYFMENVYLGDAVRWKSDAFRRSDPHRRKILAHAPGPRYGSSEDWRMSRAGLDIYGCSCYPGWGEFQDPGVTSEQRLKDSPAPYLQMLDNALKWDYIRGASVNGEFWTAELQGGRASGGITPGRVPDPGDIRRWVLGALAGGVRGICFWNHRSEIFWDEAYGFGLLELEGDRTARAEEAGRIGKALSSKDPELFGRGACPPAKVAILLDEGLWNFVRSSGDLISGAFVAQMRGVHRALFQSGIAVDLLDSTDLRERGAQYGSLILPLPISMSTALMKQVRDYVNNGGTLISGPFPGRFSQYGFGVPGEMPREMVELFGASHKQILTIEDRPGHPSQSSFKPENAKALRLSATGSYSGSEIEPHLYLQYLTPTTGTPLLQLGSETIGVQNRFGKGEAILLGTLFGQSVLDGSLHNQKFLAAILKNAGVMPECEAPLIRRRRTYGNRAAWFFFNPTRETVEQRVALGQFQKAADLLGSDLVVESGAVKLTVGPLDIACLLLS